MGQQCTNSNTIDQNELRNNSGTSAIMRNSRNNSSTQMPSIQQNIKTSDNHIRHFSKIEPQSSQFNSSSKIAHPVEIINNKLGSYVPMSSSGSVSKLKESRIPKGIKQQNSYTLNQEGLIYRQHGEWKNGMPHGKGELIYPNGSYYIGYLVNGVPHGEGRFISVDGWYYEGQLENQQAEGWGAFNHPSLEFQYEGQWAGDLPDGKGVEIWRKEGHKVYYEGEFLKGFKHGQGKYVTDNFSYEGKFEDNELNGYGKIIYKNGQSYEGDFRDGMKHGRGVYTWTDKSRYEGQYLDDKKHGIGKYFASNGKTFDGEWVKGKRQGKGVIFADNRKYYYEWKATSQQTTNSKTRSPGGNRY